MGNQGTSFCISCFVYGSKWYLVGITGIMGNWFCGYLDILSHREMEK